MTRETLQNIFRNPYSLEIWQNLLINLFGASEIRKTPAEIESDKHDKVSGYLLGVNPFDQPGVEVYKKSMFKILGKPTK